MTLSFQADNGCGARERAQDPRINCILSRRDV